MTPVRKDGTPLRPTGEELERPSAVPLVVIGGLLSGVIVTLGLLLGVGSLTSLLW